MAPGDRLLAVGLPGLALTVVGLAASRSLAGRRLAAALAAAERSAQERLRGAASAERRRLAAGVRDVVRRDVDVLADRVAAAERAAAGTSGAGDAPRGGPDDAPRGDPDDAPRGGPDDAPRGGPDLAAALDDVQRAAAGTLEDLRGLLDAVDPRPGGPSDALRALGVRPDVARGTAGPSGADAARADRPPAADVALALGTAAIVLIDVTVLPVPRPVVSAVLGITSTALPLALRRRAPLVVAGAAGVGLVGGSLLGDLPAGPVAPYFILTIVPFAAGSHAPTVGRALAGVAITTGSAIVAVAPQARGGGWPRPRDLAALAGYGVLAGAVTWYARHHRVRALALALDADELRRRHPDLVRAVREEQRSRVARDLHDAVSHGVTVCAVLAGGAAASARTGSPAGPGDLRPLRRAVGGVHRELDALVRALGLPEDEARERTPAGPLDPLVELVRDAGPGIPLRVQVDAGRRIPPAVADAVYRIVQEALTNAARHGGGPATGVVVRSAGAVLEVEVLSGPGGDARTGAPGPPDPDGPPAEAVPRAPVGSGRGLPGMRRRAEELGGRLEAGPLPGGGFRVAARLPLRD